METLISKLFFHNWQRKLVAIITALIVWIVVNHSILDTKTIPNIPVRIVNIPADKMVPKLLPNGMLNRRMTLTLTGTKEIIDELEPADLEVLLDASQADHDDWIVQISKKNLVSLNPSIDLLHHITDVSHSEFMIKIRQLVTAKVPIIILPPTGEPPTGYDFLDIWPPQLMQTISGSEEDIQALKAKGLDLQFDLSEITKEDLENAAKNQNKAYNDEVSFSIPSKWKQVIVSFHNNVMEEINDPEAQYLRVYFLKKEFLPIERDVSIRTFYPLKYIETLNPNTFPIAISTRIVKKNDLYMFTVPIYIKNVSRLFLEIIRDNLEIDIVAAPKSEREILQWNLEVIDPHELEDTYVALQMANSSAGKNQQTNFPRRKEAFLRLRFQEYLNKLTPYISKEQKLTLEPVLEEGKLVVKPY
jgi:hypothetical protein